MIYIGIRTTNNARTVGLVLWKIRQVFEEFHREYQLLVVLDGCTDDTAEVLEPYQRALPLTLIDAPERGGHAGSLSALCAEAVARTDRPKRDSLILVPPDFSVSPAMLPELVKRMESGADLVIAEAHHDENSLWARWVRRSAAWLLRPGVRLSGVHDLMSGMYAFRLSTVKSCLRARSGELLDTIGECAQAELVARAATCARQIAVTSTSAVERVEGAEHESHPFALALSLARAGRTLRIPPPQSAVQRVSA